MRVFINVDGKISKCFLSYKFSVVYVTPHTLQPIPTDYSINPIPTYNMGFILKKVGAVVIMSLSSICIQNEPLVLQHRYYLVLKIT